MGEKETGTATEEGERRQHGPGPMRPTSSLRESPSRASSGRSIPENSPDPADVDGDGALESSVKSSKSNSSERQASGTGADAPDGGPLESTVKCSKSNSSERQGAGDLSPDTDEPTDLDDEGGGTLDEGPVFVLKQKTKSNQSND